MVPAEVLTWVRDVFGSCNRAVTAQLSNNPNAAEESFDHAWIAHLNGYATPRRLGNGWTVKIETHFLGGMRHFRRWEIADIGILLFIRDPLRVATRKVALLQSKRLYPTTMTVREETTVDYEIGFARLADPSDLARSIAYESQFTFNGSCRYGELVADSDQVRAITEFQRDIGPTVYYHLYNPWRLPYRITVPTDRRRRFRGHPPVGVRVLGSAPVHRLLQERTPGHRPAYAELVEACGSGWTLPEFMADELVACREGYRYEENDDAIFNVFNRRSGAIAAAIALTLEAPDAIDPARSHSPAKPSLLRQMSREWLNDPSNPAMAEWSLRADDLYAGVMIVDLALAQFRVALSGDFERYTPITDPKQLASLGWLD